jgi:hypothetical protein
MFPFYTTYDGYGRGHNSHGIGLSITMDAIRNSIVPGVLSDGTVLDKTSFDESIFWHAIYLRELNIIAQNGIQYQVDVSMIRCDIISDILQQYRMPQYMNNFGIDRLINVTYQDIMNGLPAAISHLQKLDISKPFFYEMMPDNVAWRELLDCVFKYTYVSICRVSKVLNGYRIKQEWDNLSEALKCYLIGNTLDNFMYDTRRIWCPQGGQGSQGADVEPYELLNRIIGRVITEIKRDEENDS